VNNFWLQLQKPFFVLAPMDDVTDTVFRQVVASVGKPDVFFTEFTHVDLICHSERSEESRTSLDPSAKPQDDKLLQRLVYTETEHPIVAQVWGNIPEQFAKAAKIIKTMGFDGIDINLGCPVRDVVKQGACSALIGQNNLVAEIITATRQAGLPVSVKTRIGTKKIITEEWISFLLTQNLAALTIHGRTAAEMSLVPAHWDEIAKATKLPNPSKTLIIGNGDVKNLLSAKHLALSTGVDGVMIGRGIFENIGLFAEKELSQAEKLELLKKHVLLFEQTWGKTKNFQIMKKFVKAYVSGFAGAALIRQRLMATGDIAQLRSELDKR